MVRFRLSASVSNKYFAVITEHGGKKPPFIRRKRLPLANSVEIVYLKFVQLYFKPFNSSTGEFTLNAVSLLRDIKEKPFKLESLSAEVNRLKNIFGE